jgi:nicotinamidase-related amidase
MPSRQQLLELLEMPTTVLLTVECRQGVVGKDSALPELAAQASASGALRNVARLVDAAHEAGVQVLHAVAERHPDGRESNRNARLCRAAERLPVQRHTGSAAVRVAPPIEVAPEDLVVGRLHGLSPLAGTGSTRSSATSAAAPSSSPASRPMRRCRLPSSTR